MESETAADSGVLVDAFAGVIGHRAVLNHHLPAINIHSMPVLVRISPLSKLPYEQTVPHQVHFGAVDAAAVHRAGDMIIVNDGDPDGHGPGIETNAASVTPTRAIVHHGIPFHAAIGQPRALFKAA